MQARLQACMCMRTLRPGPPQRIYASACRYTYMRGRGRAYARPRPRYRQALHPFGIYRHFEHPRVLEVPGPWAGRLGEAAAACLNCATAAAKRLCAIESSGRKLSKSGLKFGSLRSFANAVVNVLLRCTCAAAAGLRFSALGRGAAAAAAAADLQVATAASAAGLGFAFAAAACFGAAWRLGFIAAAPKARSTAAVATAVHMAGLLAAAAAAPADLEAVDLLTA